MAIGGFQVFICEKCGNCESVFHTDVIIFPIYPPTQKECEKCGGVMLPKHRLSESSKQKDDVSKE